MLAQCGGPVGQNHGRRGRVVDWPTRKCAVQASRTPVQRGGHGRRPQHPANVRGKQPGQKGEVTEQGLRQSPAKGQEETGIGPVSARVVCVAG